MFEDSSPMFGFRLSIADGMNKSVLGVERFDVPTVQVFMKNRSTSRHTIIHGSLDSFLQGKMNRIGNDAL